MSDKIQELYDAAFGVLPYLKASTDPFDLAAHADRARLSAGDRLRKEANEADKRDAAIFRLREALTNFAVGQA
jgi:hypothetical protein